MDRVKKLIHLNYAYKTGLTGKTVTIAAMDTGERVIIMSS